MIVVEDHIGRHLRSCNFTAKLQAAVIVTSHEVHERRDRTDISLDSAVLML
jgi:hypothetical protein